MSRPSAVDLTATITALVDAVRAGDRDVFADASIGLTKPGLEQVGIVQAATIRSLLEQTYPDGLDSEDVRGLLVRCSAGAAWWPDFDPDALLLVFGGALGMIDPDEQPQPRRAVLAQHATLVIVELSAKRPTALAGELKTALDEIRRAETIELP